MWKELVSVLCNPLNAMSEYSEWTDWKKPPCLQANIAGLHRHE